MSLTPCYLLHAISLPHSIRYGHVITELASERVLRQADVKVVVVRGRERRVLFVHHLDARRRRVRWAGAHGHARHARHHHGLLPLLPAGREGGAHR